jgi:hypothetical protein
LTLSRGLAREDVLDANILVKVWPTNPSPLTDKSPVTPLLDGAMKKTRVPRKRRRDCAAIREIERQRVGCDGYRCRRSRPGLNH